MGAMGEFDVAILVDEYAGTEISRQVFPRWRGGYYYSALPKSDKNAPLALLYVSRWSDPDAAEDFAAIYARSLEHRYHRVDQAIDNPNSTIPQLKTLKTINGTHSWRTEEGIVVISVQRDMVLVTESFDQATTNRLRQELLDQKLTTK